MVDSVTTILRTIFFFFDSVVYGLIDQAYWLFSMLSEATIFTADQIADFSNRMYVLLTIIMLFKLAFSFITYVINPDSITDKQKGGGKLIQNIVICIALLASVPMLFNEAYYLQKALFSNNVIQKVLLGDNTTTADTADSTKMLSVYTFLSFFRPTTKLSECRNYTGLSLTDSCVSALNEDSDGKIAGTSYQKALSEGTLSYIWGGDLKNISTVFAGTSDGTFYQNEEYYLFDYNYLISTVVGIGLVWILIGFCLDLAIRSVKLGFLQMIAPIPIMLSLTPGKKNNTLANWGKECLSTWASLFVRIGVIAFALNLILLINTSGGIFSFVSGTGNTYPMVTVFITFGLLLFAKEVPKLLEDLLGIKNASKLTLNPFKKMAEAPLLGGLATKAGGALAAGGSLAGNFLKNAALLGGGAAVGRGDRALEKFKERNTAMLKEAQGRYDSGGWSADKKYSGDTQRSLMHKSNLETRQASRTAKLEKKQNERDTKEGNEHLAKIDEVKPILDKIAADGKATEEDLARITSAYSKVSSNGDYANKSAMLAATKSGNAYLNTKLTEAQATLQAANTPEERAAAAVMVNKYTKQVKDSTDQIDTLKKQIESLTKADKGVARVEAQIAAAKAAPKIDNVSPKTPTAPRASTETAASEPHPTSFVGNDGNQLYSDGTTRPWPSGQGGFNAASGNRPGSSMNNSGQSSANNGSGQGDFNAASGNRPGSSMNNSGQGSANNGSGQGNFNTASGNRPGSSMNNSGQGSANNGSGQGNFNTASGNRPGSSMNNSGQIGTNNGRPGIILPGQDDNRNT
ncbi:MAG: hypothetical protein PHD02_01605 [Bacilli bacterium]|nr:hypothetical protein [Bacilli bacterium]